MRQKETFISFQLHFLLMNFCGKAANMHQPWQQLSTRSWRTPRCEGNVTEMFVRCYISPRREASAWSSTSINSRKAVSLFWFFTCIQLSLCGVKSFWQSFTIPPSFLKKKRCILLIFKESSAKNSCFTNSFDSKKNKPCQFCRMCSFLFTASGGQKRSDAPKHNGKRYPSKSA